LDQRSPAVETQRPEQWHQQRLAAYTTAWTRLSSVALAMQEVAAKNSKPRLLASPLAPFRVLQQAVPVHSALREATEALTVIRFIGSKEVIDAADQCANVIVKLGDAVAAGDAAPEDLKALVDEMDERRHHLVDVARIELDVDVRGLRGRRGPGRSGGSAERIAALNPEPPAH
jgi:hypothetical protein